MFDQSAIEDFDMSKRPKLLHLAAEYNATRVHGVEVDMNEMIRLYEAGEWSDNSRYMERTIAQVHAMSALMAWEGGLKPIRYFDDVSRVPATGQHSPKPEYRENVRRSVDHHRALFERFEPDGVIVAGGEALDAFLDIVVPALSTPPPLVVGMRNPGDQGHRGSWENGWRYRYQEVSTLLMGTAQVMQPMPTVYKLVSRNAKVPFRLQPLKARQKT